MLGRDRGASFLDAFAGMCFCLKGAREAKWLHETMHGPEGFRDDVGRQTAASASELRTERPAGEANAFLLTCIGNPPCTTSAEAVFR